ncbi:MAG: PHP domain-containing protein [Candidatus Aminicenantes bacterium]|nr:PHP domain-containing protein [Candidatus Aminicenantes bacterium]
MRRLLSLILLVGLASINVSPEDSRPLRWYKGNTHTHTLNSDGDVAPDEAVRWYRGHGYHFLVLSDHNFLTDTAGLNAVFGAEGKFLLIPGEEITDEFEKLPVHINGLGLRRLVEPRGGTSVADAIQRNVEAIRKAGGLPHFNHPNFVWAAGAADLKGIKGLRHFEIFNGHPQVNNLGGGGFPGTEEIWDGVLSSGQLLYGLATDDTHNFKAPGEAGKAWPGRGWIMVRAARLTAVDLLQAIERGDFYSSTGVILKDYQAGEREIRITIAETGKTKHAVRFIGKGGAVLAETFDNPAVYTFKGDELYVRAKVIDSNGLVAWTQPVFPESRR